MAKTAQKYDNANTGALFENDKGGNDNRPDFKGKLLLKAEDYTKQDDDGNIIIYLSAWTKKIKNGENAGHDFLSIQAQPPFEG